MLIFSIDPSTKVLPFSRMKGANSCVIESRKLALSSVVTEIFPNTSSPARQISETF